MGQNRNKLSRKAKLKLLSNLCLKHFGENFKHWNWVIDSGNIDGYPKKIAAAIELPKYDINNKLHYTDPFIAKSGGEAKSLEMCCDNAIEWIYNIFENIE